MKLRHHLIPDEVFTTLAAGNGGARAVGHLTAAQYSKHVLLVRGVVDRTRAIRHEQADRIRHAYDLLADIQERVPNVVESVLRHPSVGAWARRTLQSLGDDASRGSAEPLRLAALAAAAAIRSRTPCSVRVPAIDGVVMLPSVGRADVSPFTSPFTGEALLRSHRDGAEVIAGDSRVVVPADPSLDAPGWHGLRSLSAIAGGKSVHLLIDDLDPYRMPAARDLAARLTSREVEAWQSVFHAAWEMLVRHHRITAEEVRTAIRVLTPRVPPPSGQVSASSRETFGCVALSAPLDAHMFAVTLTHEVQHAKLAALLDLVRLTRHDNGARFYAPWRDDPRPISGLLQGAYAYLGVTGFWRRQRGHEKGDAALYAHSEFARWRTATDMVVETLLASGLLTTAGQRFVAGIAGTLRAWHEEDIPSAALVIARRKAERHRTLWRLRHGDINQACGSPCP
jgi:uncharacterized protein